MKALSLQKRLNTTRVVHYKKEENQICIASEMVHDLIKMNPGTGKIIYSLDTFNRGWRNELKEKDELFKLCESLDLLYKSGELKQFTDSDEVFENPITIFSVEEKIYRGESNTITIKESTCSQLSYGGVTAQGQMLYSGDENGDGTWFKTKKLAVKNAMKEAEYWIHSLSEKESELKKELSKISQKKENIEASIEIMKKKLLKKLD